MISRNGKPKKKKFSKKQVEAAREEKKKRAWMVNLMAQSLYKIVEIKGNIDLTAAQVDSIPKDWLKKMNIQVSPNGVKFVLRKEEGKIIRPGLVIPG